MGKIIKISTRRNLFYLLQVIFHYYSRKVVLIIITQMFEFSGSLIFTILMLLGEFFAGLTIHLYQIFFFEKKENKKTKYFGIELIQKEKKINRPDSKLKIGLLIFFTASFDFIEFVIDSYYIPKYWQLSKTITPRFGGVIIIFSSLLCYFNLRLKISKHQFYSLLIIGICSIIIIIFEIIYRGKETTIASLVFPYFLIFINLILVTFTDVVEKYLLEYDFMSPFITLMVESIFGLILASFYTISENPFNDMKKLYESSDGGKYVLLIFLLFLYLAFSAGANVYKLLSNVLYSPMAKSLAGYILNPFVFIYYFINEDDFASNGEKNYFHFFINIFLAITISFFGCVYNEFLVLSCCGLEYDTYAEISMRAKSTIIHDINKEINDDDNNSVFEDYQLHFLKDIDD